MRPQPLPVGQTTEGLLLRANHSEEKFGRARSTGGNNTTINGTGVCENNEGAVYVRMPEEQQSARHGDAVLGSSSQKLAAALGESVKRTAAVVSNLQSAPFEIRTGGNLQGAEHGKRMRLRGCVWRDRR